MCKHNGTFTWHLTLCLSIRSSDQQKYSLKVKCPKQSRKSILKGGKVFTQDTCDIYNKLFVSPVVAK